MHAKEKLADTLILEAQVGSLFIQIPGNGVPLNFVLIRSYIEHYYYFWLVEFYKKEDSD